MNKRILFCSFCCLMLNACQIAGTLYNAGHKVTSVILDDRAIKDDYIDTKLNLVIRKKLAQKDIKYFLDIEVTVFEGYVLLNGALPETTLIDEVNELVWQTEGVKKVYNYIRLDTPPKISIVNEDAAISAKIRYELSLTKDVSSLNYKLTMETGTIYLMGITKNDEELKKVLAVIKNTVSVQKIIVLTRYQN